MASQDDEDEMLRPSRGDSIRYEIVVLSEMLLKWCEFQRDAPPRTDRRAEVTTEYTATFEALLLHARVMTEFLGVSTDSSTHRAVDFGGAYDAKRAKEAYGLGPLYGALCTDLAHLGKQRQMKRWDLLGEVGRPLITAFGEFVDGTDEPAADLSAIEDGYRIAGENLAEAERICSELPEDHQRHDPFHMPTER